MSEVVVNDPPPDYGDCSPAERAHAIEQLAALLSATTAELLGVIATANQAEDWKVDGASSMAPWLVATLGVSWSTARGWVTAAGQLTALPALREALATGAMSWDQVSPAATFLEPDTEATVVEQLRGCSAATFESMARQHRIRRREEDREAARVRRFHWRPNHAAGGCSYSGFLPTELSEQVNQVLTRMADGVGPDAETGLWAPFDVRVADALVELSRVRIGADVDPDTCLVVVHADAPVIDGEREGNGMIGDLPISTDSVLCLLCDSKVEFAVDGPDGTTIGIGRAARPSPRWLRRRIAHRDGVCRFPGCGRAIRHRHHLQHWTRGGVTDSSNLVGLCWLHHHLVHEGGWTIEGNPDHDITFVSPVGRRLQSRPQTVLPAVHRRVRRAAGLSTERSP